tara:strand:+ start:138 stop:326 length:189 start_codon:yes stop_codon:yes gene_type:complete
MIFLQWARLIMSLMILGSTCYQEIFQEGASDGLLALAGVVIAPYFKEDLVLSTKRDRGEDQA